MVRFLPRVLSLLQYLQLAALIDAGNRCDCGSLERHCFIGPIPNAPDSASSDRDVRRVPAYLGRVGIVIMDNAGVLVRPDVLIDR